MSSLDAQELKRLIDKYLSTLPDGTTDEWYDTDRGLHKRALDDFSKATFPEPDLEETMLTEWEDLIGKTIVKVIECFPGSYGPIILVFEDGERAQIGARGEDTHGMSWPTISIEGE